MNALCKILAGMVCGLLVGLPSALAGDDDYFPLTDVFIHVGTHDNKLTVSPPALTLRVGELYRLVVINPSETTHIVAAPEIAAISLTTDLVTGTPRVDYPTRTIAAGISVRPGQLMEWTLMPLEKGTYKFGCDDPVHAAAGMHTTVTVAL